MTVAEGGTPSLRPSPDGATQAAWKQKAGRDGGSGSGTGWNLSMFAKVILVYLPQVLDWFDEHFPSALRCHCCSDFTETLRHDRLFYPAGSSGAPRRETGELVCKASSSGVAFRTATTELGFSMA
jgi:hypothetical protein